jgi:anti-sigma factor RsiW
MTSAMRQDHLNPAEIKAYSERTLAPEQALGVSDHLLQCEECRAAVLRREPAVADSNVAYNDLAAFLDDTLDPWARREMRAKIASSSRALTELQDLREYKHEAAASDENPSAYPFRSTWLLPLAAAVIAGTALVWWATFSQPRAGVVLHDNGIRLQISPDGSVIGLPNLPSELRTSLKSVLSENRLNVAPFLAALTGRANVLAGAGSDGGSLRIVSPRGVAVENPSPLLEWTPDDRAMSYRVTVARKSDDAVSEAAEVSNRQSSWRPQEPLARGETFAWQIESIRDGETIATAPGSSQPEAQFYLLSDREEEELNAAKASFGKSHLAMALAYARFGLTDQADAELRSLEQDNPGSTLPPKLRAALRNAVVTSPQ